MSLSDPRLIYILIALPILFGLTLVGDGIDKITHGLGGWISLSTGIVFILLSVLIWIFTLYPSF